MITIAVILFVIFITLMLIGLPIGAALGIGGIVAITLSNLDTANYGLLAVPQNFYAGIAKYPLLAIPMFVLVGSIFDRSGVAERLVNFAVAIVGRGPGMLPLVAILVAMFLGGISGSGPANAAAVGGVMIAAMANAGYPRAFAASIVGAAAATDILIPPSVAFVVYSVLVPGASVPALFAAGMFPGLLAGIALIVPAVWLARKHKMGALEAALPRPPFWKSCKEALWGLSAPFIILGGMRAGWFTPTEAAVVAVFYGLFVGMVIYRTIKIRDLYVILLEAGETMPRCAHSRNSRQGRYSARSPLLCAGAARRYARRKHPKAIVRTVLVLWRNTGYRSQRRPCAHHSSTHGGTNGISGIFSAVSQVEWFGERIERIQKGALA